MDDVDLNLLGAQLQQLAGESLHRTVHITLDDDVELLEVSDGDTAADLLEGDMLLRAQTHLTGEACAFGGDAAGLLLGFANLEGITGLRGAVQTQQQHRLRGTCRLHRLVTLVEHGLDLAEAAAGQNRVTHSQGTVLHQHLGDVTAALVQSGLDNRTYAGTVRVGLQVEEVSLQ